MQWSGCVASHLQRSLKARKTGRKRKSALGGSSDVCLLFSLVTTLNVPRKSRVSYGFLTGVWNSAISKLCSG